MLRVLTIAASLLVATGKAAIFGQTTTPKDFLRETLSKSINIKAGRYDLRTLLQEVSAQSKIPVQCESYLEERTVACALGKVTLKNAIDAICEVNDFDWKTINGKRILIYRRVPKLELADSDMSAFIRQILPMDMRTYLHIDKLDSDDEPTRTSFGFLFHDLINNRQKRMQVLISELQTRLKNSKTLKYVELTERERDLLMDYHFLRFYEGTSDALNSQLGPNRYDWNTTTLTSNTNILMVYSKYFTRKEGEWSTVGFSISELPKP